MWKIFKSVIDKKYEASLTPNEKRLYIIKFHRKTTMKKANNKEFDSWTKDSNFRTTKEKNWTILI
jgi:hypothetical protein